MYKILKFIIISLAINCALSSAQADSLKIATTIAPIHSLVSKIVTKEDSTALLIPVNQSPHHYILRPSDVKKLSLADVVFRVSPKIETQISEILHKFGTTSKLITLTDYLQNHLLPQRQGFHGHHGHNSDDHKDRDGSKDHHIWMSSQNAQQIIQIVVTHLSKQNPSKADIYRSNGHTTLKALTSLKVQIQQILTHNQPKAFAVMHDSFQYFETEFGLTNAGSLVLSPEQGASAKHLRTLNTHLINQNARCLFGEPQLNLKLAQSIAKDLSLHFDQLDPLGIDIPTGPNLYALMMLRNAKKFAACFAAP